MSAGAAAVATNLATQNAESALEEVMRDYFYDYLTGISERPAKFPLENQHNNLYGIMYIP